MIRCNEPMIIMTQAELTDIIKETVKVAVAEALKQLPRTTHGVRPLSVTQSEAARMLRLNRSTISKLVRAGTFKLDKTGRIPIEQIDQALTTY